MKYLDYEEYDIHPDGTVVSYKRKTPRVLKYDTTEHYHRVKLFKGNNSRKLLVHRLVAECFIPNPLNLPEVNHKDGNKLNNHIDNLEWCTHKENTQHAYDIGLNTGLKGEENPISKLTEVEVLEIREKYIPHIYSQNMLAKEYGVDQRLIFGIIHREFWKHI